MHVCYSWLACQFLATRRTRRLVPLSLFVPDYCFMAELENKSSTQLFHLLASCPLPTYLPTYLLTPCLSRYPRMLVRTIPLSIARRESLLPPFTDYSKEHVWHRNLVFSGVPLATDCWLALAVHLALCIGTKQAV